MKSIRWKVTLLLLAIGGPFVAAAFFGILWTTEQSQIQTRKAAIRRGMNRLATVWERGRRISDDAEVNQALNAGVDAAVFNRDGKVLWQSSSKPPILGQDRGLQQISLSEGTLVYRMPQGNPDVAEVAWRAVAPTALITAGFLIGAYFLVGRTLKPISEVVTQVREASERDEGLVVAPSNDQEVQALVNTLNDLIRKVRSDSEERVRDYASLSHEIRTPIQSLLGHLELAFSQPRSKDELKDLLLEVQAQVLRLHHLSDAVLLLQHKVPSEGSANPVDLGRVLGSILESVEPICEVRNLAVKCDLQQTPAILANPEHVEMLARNLIENASKHAPLASTVHVTVAGGKLTVVNDVAARVEGATQPSSLLGLRICHAIARKYGWTFEAKEEGAHFVGRVDFGN